MTADATVTTSDFWPALRSFVRLLYEEIVAVSIVSLFASLLAFPVVTIGPVCLAAVATTTTVAEHRNSPTALTDRERLGLFARSFRRYFRTGLAFSALILASAAIFVVYFLFAAANGSPVFWFGAGLGLYTLLAVVALTFRAGSVIVRAGEDAPSPAAAMRRGADIWLRSPGYAAVHLLIAGALQVGLLLVTPAAMVLLAGSLALLEVVAYEDLAGDGVASLFE